MRLRHSEEDYPDDNFVPPELRQQDYTQDVEAPEMIPSGELAGVDAAPAPASPVPQGPSREELLRKVLEQQQASDADRAKKISNAAKLDRKRQSEDDLGAMLYAATARKSPQFRNVGDSFSKEAAAEGNQGPLSRELALQKVLAAYGKGADPLDAEKKRLDIENVRSLIAERGKPKEPAVKAVEYLSPAEQASLEQQLEMAAGMPVKLPRDEQGRTRKDFVGPINSSANMMGMMESKEGVAAKSRAQARKFHEDAAARKAADELAMAEGAKVEIGGEVWSPPANSKNPEAVKDIQQRARATRVVLAGLDELDRLFDEAAKKTTSPARRAAIESRIGILAPQMNVAVGQGAMSQDEFARVKQSTGDVSSTDYWLGGLKASMDGGQNVMKARIGAAKRAFRSSFEETARASRWTPAASPESIQTDSEGKKWRELPDGSFEEAP